MSTDERPCGCQLAWPCQCSPAGITERGTFQRGCVYCEMLWEGRRHEVIRDWHAHVDTDLHMANYLRRRDAVDAARQQVENAAAGMLW